MGDGNNTYFYVNLKSKDKQTHIKELEDDYGNKITDQKDIEKEVLRFYQKLIEEAATTLTQVDIIVLRNGTQLTRKQ